MSLIVEAHNLYKVVLISFSYLIVLTLKKVVLFFIATVKKVLLCKACRLVRPKDEKNRFHYKVQNNRSLGNNWLIFEGGQETRTMSKIYHLKVFGRGASQPIILPREKKVFDCSETLNWFTLNFIHIKSFFSRVLRDSISRYVGRSVGPSSICFWVQFRS